MSYSGQATRPATGRAVDGVSQGGSGIAGLVSSRSAGQSLDRTLTTDPIQQAAEGGGVGEAVHEEVKGGEAD